MDELIRRKDALNALNLVDAPFLPMNTNEHIAYVYALKNLPSVDAVEVVRCEFCEHYVGEMFFGREVFWCNRKYKQGSGMMELTDADDFCSRGERKTDG